MKMHLRVIAMLLIIALLTALLPSAFAAAGETIYNQGHRDELCTELSEQAEQYYTGAYTYDRLKTLSGASDTSTSYAAAQNNALYDALYELMSSTQTGYYSYSSLSTDFAYTDSEGGAGESEMTCLWTGRSAVWNGSYFNREHVWPKSHASFYQKNGGADRHHLRPTSAHVNQGPHSNRPYGPAQEGTAAYGETGLPGGWYTSQYFEPIDSAKGDTARILLYVYVRWQQPNLYSDLSQDQLPAMDPDDSANDGKRVISDLETLLEWCALDPVDTWEMGRNDASERIQGNRNVFIDYPELAWLLFGEEIPAGITTPTSGSCDHDWTVVITNASCTEDGVKESTCKLCGKVRTEVLPKLGHQDANHDSFCDRCGEQLSSGDAYYHSTELSGGDHAVIYFPAKGLVLGTTVNSSKRVVGVAAEPENGILYPPEDAAILTVEAAEGDNVYLLLDGKYLTSGATGNSLSYENKANQYSLWYVTDAGDGTVVIRNVNASYGGERNQALEYYQNGFTVYGFNEDSENFFFELYTDSIAPHAHSWEQKATVAPTCTSDGIVVYVCSVCGITDQAAGAPALGHDYGAWTQSKAPTCTQKGSERRDCSRCDAFETRDVDPLGHAWNDGVVTTAPTEHTTGVRTYTCTRCSETKTETIPPLSHTHSYTEVVTEPTCTERGYTTHVCACGDRYVDAYVDALGHAWNDGVVTTAPTEDETGVRTYTCTRCGETRTEIIPPITHVHNYFDFVTSPTCTEQGYTMHYCHVCDDSYVDSYVDALGHDFGAWTVAKASTCTETGEETRGCSRCDATETREIAALGHEFVDGVCTVCGEADPNVPSRDNPFEDVKDGDYFYDAVLWAVDQRITTGTTPTTFRPDNLCTRAEIVTFLWRAYGEPMPEKNENPFADVVEGKYYYNAVLWAVEKGITKGTSANRFGVDDTCTRAQAVTFLWRAAGQPEHEATENKFVDLNANSYYYDAVLWAVENGIAKGTTDTTFRPESSCTRGQIVTFLYRSMAE